jgi:hypothetical protein
MSDRITLHEANGDRRGFISADQAAVLARAGMGFAVHSRSGKLVRFVLYPDSQERVHFDVREGVLALHNCSRTTRPVRADGTLRRGPEQLLGNTRAVREHRTIST